MRYTFSVLGLAIAGAAVLVAPPRAAACTCSISPIYRSVPVSGAEDVPLNHAILVEGVFDAKTVRLEDGSGRPVDFDLNAGPSPTCPGTSADLIPKKPLSPDTRYVVRVDPLYPEFESVSAEDATSLEFTTGNELLPDPALEPPRGAASVVFDAPPGMCGNGSDRVFTCLGVPKQEGVVFGDSGTEGIELTLRKGDEVLLRAVSLVGDGIYGSRSVPDCVELRRRAPTGKLSAPLQVCGDALRPMRWMNTSTHPGTACRAGEFGDSAPPSGRDQPDAGVTVDDARVVDIDAGPPASDDPERRRYGCVAAPWDGGASSARTITLLAFTGYFVSRRHRASRR